ncbi:MAG: hypothetical protein M1824_004865 [Vezdaea acicularis]|nr:MAG: hypothetical protein M1824_004865 [Vezdaea acicularis]
MAPPFLLRLLTLSLLLSTLLAELPPDDEELICSSSDPSSCYPRLFRPTSEFQAVLPMQDIPSGLHIRLNIATGEKEAKINVPDEVEQDGGGRLESGAAEGAVVVVPHDKDEDEKDKLAGAGESQKPLQLQDRPPIPASDPFGRIKPPPPSSDDHALYDTTLSALLTILTNPPSTPVPEPSLLPPLTTLTELAHSPYHGHQLTSHPLLPSHLLTLLTTHPSPPLRAQSIILLSTSLRNNPPAQHALTTSHPTLLDLLLHRLVTDASATVQTRLIALISSLLDTERQRELFGLFNGLGVLKRSFDARHTRYDGRDGVRARIGVFVGDWVRRGGSVLTEGPRGKDGERLVERDGGWCADFEGALGRWREEGGGEVGKEGVREGLEALKERGLCGEG